MSVQNSDILTCREAARMLRVSERTVSNYRMEGRLPCHRFSRRKFVYKKSDIEKFLGDTYQEVQLSLF